MIVKSVEKKEHNELSIVVEINKEEFEEAINAAYLKNKKSISVPGFRKGKAPRMVIEGMYGSDVFHNDAIEELAPNAFKFATESEKLETVGRPEVTDTDVAEDKTLVLTYKSALYPEVTLGQYKGIEAPKEEINITDADVDKYLAEMQKRNARQSVVERAAKMGDSVNINFDGYLNGEPFEGGKGENYDLELGSNTFVPGFEEQLVDLSAGDEKEITITFPEDYKEDLAGKEVQFKVKVNQVMEIELPEVDDEFTKDVSEFDKLSEYKEAIMEQLVASRTKAVNEDFGYSVMQKATENMTCDIPESMIDERIESIMMDYDRNLMAQGMRLEEYLRMSGMDPYSFHQVVKPQAEAQIKTDLLLEAVAKVEDIQVSDEDIEEACKGIAETYHTTLEEIMKSIPKDAMVKDMQKKRANDLIMESAVGLPSVKEEAAKETTEKKPKAKKAAAEKETAEEKPKAKKAAVKEETAEEKPKAKKTTRKAPAKKKPDADKPAETESAAE